VPVRARGLDHLSPAPEAGVGRAAAGKGAPSPPSHTQSTTALVADWRGVKAEQKKAGWGDDYLLHVLTQGIP